jgi:hypothetical protein
MLDTVNLSWRLAADLRYPLPDQHALTGTFAPDRTHR